MYTEQLGSVRLVIAKALAKRNHLAPGPEQTSSSLSTRRGSPDTPPVQSCPARASLEALSEEQGQAQPPAPLTHAVVADAAVRGAGRPEDLTRVAVLELHDLVVDLEVLDARGRALTLRHGPVGGLCQREPGTDRTCCYNAPGRKRQLTALPFLPAGSEPAGSGAGGCSSVHAGQSQPGSLEAGKEMPELSWAC